MSGVFISRAPLPRYDHTWDVDFVFKYLISFKPCEKFKITSFMALLTACRLSELYHLDLILTQIFPNENVFKIVQLTKTQKVEIYSIKLIFSDFENDMFDVRKHIIQYLNIIEPIRNVENSIIFFAIF